MKTDKFLIIINTIWQLAEKAFRLCSALITGILLARYLQPELYGKYNYALVFVSFFLTVSSLGSNQICIRELVQDPDANDEIVNSVLALRLFSGALFVFLSIGSSFYLLSDTTTRLLSLIFSISIFLRAFESIELFFKARLEYKYITLPKSISSGLFCCIVLSLVAAQKPVSMLAIASLGEYAFSLTIIAILYVKKKGPLCPSFVSMLRIKSLLADGWPFIISGLAITVYMKIDQLMIGTMVGSQELGLYSVAVQITEAFYLIPVAFVNSSFPSLIRAKNTDESQFYSNLQDLYSRVSMMSYLSIVIVLIFSKNILLSLYGVTYGGAAPLLVLLIWSVLFVALGTAQSAYMVSMNWNKMYLQMVLIASVINIVLNYLLLPIFGALGAAVATVFSQWVAMHGACFLFDPLRKTRNMVTKSIFLQSNKRR
ncbi:MAG: flippase [Cyanobacteria bacterium J06627_28]